MKKGIIFLFLVLILAFVNLAMTSSIKSDSGINVEKAVYEKLASEGKVRVLVYLKDAAAMPRAGLFRRIGEVSKASNTKDDLISDFSVFDKDKFKLRHDFGSSLAIEISADVLEQLKNDARIESIQEDAIVRAFLQDSVPMVNATLVLPVKVNGVNITGNGQTVCVIDTGVNYSHPDLGGCYGNGTDFSCKVIAGYDYVNNDKNPDDDNGHGTHVAGIVAANGTIKGVALGASIVAIKVLDSAGEGFTSDLIAGISWCVSNASIFNISVISMSLGTDTLYRSYCDNLSTALTSAIDNATAGNITVVVATGNAGNTTSIASPACVRNATAVGSTTKADAVSSFSNRNNITVVLAPGSSINSSRSGTLTVGGDCSCSGNYCTCSGTSMSTPHVSGAVALLKQYKKLEQNTNLTTAQIKDILNRTGKRIIDTSSGLNLSRLNVYAALVDIDLTAPNISIFSPQNKTYQTNISLPLNFTITDNLNLTNCWYAVDSGSNTTLQNCANSTFNSSLGSHTLYLYANDSKGNENSSYILFTANLNPVVNLISPPNATLNGTNLTQTFSCNASDEDGLQNITLYLWNSTAQVHANTSNKSGETYNQTNFSYALPYEGIFKWNCKAYDNSSNFSWASNGNYTITFWDYNISACRNITQAGKYTLNTSITDWNSPQYAACINISVSDVEIDCVDFGNWIDGRGVDQTKGIKSDVESGAKLTNISIKNCNITNWGWGVYYNSTENSTLNNLKVSFSNYSGINVNSSSNNNFSDIILYSNFHGFELSASLNNTLTNIFIANSYSGLYFTSSSNNTIKNLTSVNNSHTGIVFSGYSINNSLININASNNWQGIGIYAKGASSTNFMEIEASMNSYSGVSLFSDSNFIMINATVSRNGEGILLSHAHYGKLQNIRALNNSGCGIELDDSSNNVLIDLVLISNRGGICFFPNSENNTMINTTQKNSTEYDLNVTNTDSQLKNANIERYYLENATLEIENTSYVKMIFQNVTQNGTNLSADIVLRNNYTFVNSSNAIGFNRSANITFFNLQLNNPRISRNGAACPSAICTKIAYNSSNGTLIFNVTGFSAYYAEDYCGNGYCDNGETCSSCSSDCGNCPASTSSGGGGGGGGGGITIYSEGNLAEGREINRLAKKYDEIKFSLRGNEHILNVKSVQKENALFELNSASFNFTLAIGESRKFNLTDEKFYDLYIKLNTITNSKANLSIIAILEEIPFAQQSETNITKVNVTNVTKPEQNITSSGILSEEKKKQQERRLLESRRVRASLVLFILITIIISAIIIHRNHQTLKIKKSIAHSPKRILKRR
jgi:parallel beta-helix repeat protein